MQALTGKCRHGYVVLSANALQFALSDMSPNALVDVHGANGKFIHRLKADSRGSLYQSVHLCASDVTGGFVVQTEPGAVILILTV